MIKKIFIVFTSILLTGQMVMAEEGNGRIIFGDPSLVEQHNIQKQNSIPLKLWRESFVEITYTKEIKQDAIIYHYAVSNIGNVSIGAVDLGNNDIDIHAAGCEVPPENVEKLEVSSPDYSIRLERQEENPNKCISAERNGPNYLEPGQNMEITVYLNKDDPIFEKLHWTVIFGRAPTRLNGQIKAADSSDES